MRVAIISDKYKYIYIPIHKCATTSTLNWLAEIEGIQIPVKARPIKYFNQHPIEDVDKNERWNDYFRWIIVRNPFDRLVSAYCNKRENVLQNLGISEDLSFSNFIKTICNATNLNAHADLQLNFVKCRIDYIVRFENLLEGLGCIAEQLNFPDVGYPKFNVSEKGDYRQYYDDETRKLVEEKYKDSLELLNYEF